MRCDMGEIDIKKEIDKAKLYKQYKTLVYVKSLSMNYNGYILEIIESEEPVIILKDLKIVDTFPIKITDLDQPIWLSKKANNLSEHTFTNKSSYNTTKLTNKNT